MNRRGRNYDRAFKERCVRQVIDHGERPVDVANAWGVNQSTLYGWLYAERKRRKDEARKWAQDSSDFIDAGIAAKSLQESERANEGVVACRDLIRRMAGLLEMILGEIIYLEERPDDESRREWKRHRKDVIVMLKADQKIFNHLVMTGQFPEDK